MNKRLDQLQRVLAQMGHTHSVDDIVAMIEAGAMQSFALGETWIVTQIVDCPQKRVLEVFLVVGTLEETHALYDEKILPFAAEHGCNLIRAFARHGWRPWAEARGWRGGVQVYTKELY